MIDESKPSKSIRFDDPDLEERLKELFADEIAKQADRNDKQDSKTDFYTNRAARRAVIKAARRKR